MDQQKNPRSSPYMQNRELSWLRFNQRVLEEAADETVPLLERLKFVSIFSSNLDEFFMIRVGGLYGRALLGDETRDNKSHLTPQEQLERIYSAVSLLYPKRDAVYQKIRAALPAYGIVPLTMELLTPEEKKFVKEQFRSVISPILSPQIIDTHHPFPHLQSKVLHIAARLKRKSTIVFGILQLPGTLPRLLRLGENSSRYILLEQVLLHYAGQIFAPYEVLEKTCLCITRNADLSYEETDWNADFRNQMKLLLHKRGRLSVVRLELTEAVSPSFLQYFWKKFSIAPQHIFLSQTPIDLSYVFSLEKMAAPAAAALLTYPPFTPQIPDHPPASRSMLRQAEHEDLLLSYPFDSMEPFLRLLKEAAFDPSVLSIKITIYRLSRRAKLVETLCAAAENGKEVTVLIELRARFDEQNNIDWSERLEEAGCKLIYGLDGYKVHAKLCLITRREKGSVSHVMQIGTGNYNETTARLYTDLCLITAHPALTADALRFFKNMALGTVDGVYSHLLVAPGGLKPALLQLIQREAQKGSLGRILIKVNSITDYEIIQALSEASCAGVSITLIVRGICCLLPQIPQKTEQIQVRSIVGRFLEHSRIYCFGEGPEEALYLSSADLMTRNTQRRVEAACPVYDPACRDKIHHILDVLLQDNTKARLLTSLGTYEKPPQVSSPCNAQIQLLEEAMELGRTRTNRAGSPFSFFQTALRRWKRH
jgi:polyphosphate kinase